MNGTATDTDTKISQRRTVRKTETVQYSTRTKVGNRAHRTRFHQPEPEFRIPEFQNSRIPGWFLPTSERTKGRKDKGRTTSNEFTKSNEFTNSRMHEFKTQNPKQQNGKRKTSNIKTQNIKTQNVKMSKMPKCLKCQMPVEVRSEH